MLFHEPVKITGGGNTATIGIHESGYDFENQSTSLSLKHEPQSIQHRTASTMDTDDLFACSLDHRYHFA